MPVTGSFAQQPANKIPDWVKTNAGWWADGSIDGTSFVQGIQYLIKEDIIIIPETTQGTSSGTDEIPEWIKNNAGWWADGSIDESSFVSSMQFLIEEGIVQVSSTNNSPPKVIPEAPPVEEPPVEEPPTTQENNKQKDKDKTKPVNDFNQNNDPSLSISEKVKLRHDKLKQKANADGLVHVIVELYDDSKPNLTAQEKVERKQNIKNALNSFKNTLSSNGIFSSKTLKNHPFIGLTVTPAVLDEIISSGLVKSVFENGIAKTTLVNTVPLVGAETLHTASTNGTGTVIAILDTGIQKEHDYFKNPTGNRIISEACFTGNDGDAPAASGTCPNDGLSQIGAGSARPCGPTDPLDNACFHGTHVAGIAAGNDMFANTTGSVGVAPAADIVSIQVFTFFGPGDVSAYFLDIAAGLEHVLFLQDDTLDTLNIVSVNLSLGVPGFTTAFTCDNAAGGAITSAINALDADGVAVIISSGNDGIGNGISFPACITKAISVGSVDRFDYAPKYSNISNLLDLLAPGGNADCNLISTTCFIDKDTDDGVLSALFHETLTNKLAFATGTSMAAPHVAGAWALIKSNTNYPSPSIENVLYVLKNTGKLVLQEGAGITKPRINIDKAVDAFIFAHICGKDISTITSFIFGTPGNDKLYGTTGNDLIIGYAGNDAILGDSGDDCLFGNEGEDNIAGNAGNDYLSGGDGIDHLKGGDDNDTIFGGKGNDILSGGLGDDELNGDSGDDTLLGREGADTMNGGDGSDILDGAGINEDNAIDILNGDAGDDFLYGRGGIDILDGGADTDWCVPGDGETVSNCEIVS